MSCRANRSLRSIPSALSVSFINYSLIQSSRMLHLSVPRSRSRDRDKINARSLLSCAFLLPRGKSRTSRGNERNSVGSLSVDSSRLIGSLRAEDSPGDFSERDRSCLDSARLESERSLSGFPIESNVASTDVFLVVLLSRDEHVLSSARTIYRLRLVGESLENVSCQGYLISIADRPLARCESFSGTLQRDTITSPTLIAYDRSSRERSSPSTSAL